MADDDRDVREFLERFLPVLGHSVHSVAKTGRELVEHCRINQPDMIIADVKMPDMNGLEAVEQVNRIASVPAILVTGHSVPELGGQGPRTRGHGLPGQAGYRIRPGPGRSPWPGGISTNCSPCDRESADLRQALEDRKLIERAKEVSRPPRRVPEAEAYRRMRKVASNGNRKLIDVARQVLTAEEVFHAFEESAG